MSLRTSTRGERVRAANENFHRQVAHGLGEKWKDSDDGAGCWSSRSPTVFRRSDAPEVRAGSSVIPTGRRPVRKAASLAPPPPVVEIPVTPEPEPEPVVVETTPVVVEAPVVPEPVEIAPAVVETKLEPEPEPEPVVVKALEIKTTPKPARADRTVRPTPPRRPAVDRSLPHQGGGYQTDGRVAKNRPLSEKDRRTRDELVRQAERIPLKGFARYVWEEHNVLYQKDQKEHLLQKIRGTQDRKKFPGLRKEIERLLPRPAPAHTSSASTAKPTKADLRRERREAEQAERRARAARRAESVLTEEDRVREAEAKAVAEQAAK